MLSLASNMSHRAIRATCQLIRVNRARGKKNRRVEVPSVVGGKQTSGLAANEPNSTSMLIVGGLRRYRTFV